MKRSKTRKNKNSKRVNAKRTTIGLVCLTPLAVVLPAMTTVSCSNAIDFADTLTWYVNGSTSETDGWDDTLMPSVEKAYYQRMNDLVAQGYISSVPKLVIKHESGLGEGAGKMVNTWGYRNEKSPDMWLAGGPSDAKNYLTASLTPYYHQFSQNEYKKWAYDLQLQQSGADWSGTTAAYGHKLIYNAKTQKYDNLDVSQPIPGIKTDAQHWSPTNTTGTNPYPEYDPKSPWKNMRVSINFRTEDSINWHWEPESADLSKPEGRPTDPTTSEGSKDAWHYNPTWNVKTSLGLRKISNSNFGTGDSKPIHDLDLGITYKNTKLYNPIDDIDMTRAMAGIGSGWNSIGLMSAIFTYLRGPEGQMIKGRPTAETPVYDSNGNITNGVNDNQAGKTGEDASYYNMPSSNGFANTVGDLAFIPWHSETANNEKPSNKDLLDGGLGSIAIKKAGSTEFSGGVNRLDKKPGYEVYHPGTGDFNKDYTYSDTMLYLARMLSEAPNTNQYGGTGNKPITENINSLAYQTVPLKYVQPVQESQGSTSGDLRTVWGFLGGNGQDGASDNDASWGNSEDIPVDKHRYLDLFASGSDWLKFIKQVKTDGLVDSKDKSQITSDDLEEMLSHIHAYTTPAAWLMDNGNETGLKDRDGNIVDTADGHKIYGIDGKPTLGHIWSLKSTKFAGSSIFYNKRNWEINDPDKRKAKLTSLKVFSQVMHGNYTGDHTANNKTQGLIPEANIEATYKSNKTYGDEIIPEYAALNSSTPDKAKEDLATRGANYVVNYLKLSNKIPGTQAFLDGATGGEVKTQEDRITKEIIKAVSNSYVAGEAGSSVTPLQHVIKAGYDQTSTYDYINIYGENANIKINNIDKPDASDSFWAPFANAEPQVDPNSNDFRNNIWTRLLDGHIMRGASTDFSKFGAFYWPSNPQSVYTNPNITNKSSENVAELTKRNIGVQLSSVGTDTSKWGNPDDSH